jgi:hypothetical protein
VSIALGAWLVIFGVLSYATVLLASLWTVTARGIPAILELLAHGAIAALAAAAVHALLTDSPVAPRLAALAVVLVAVASIQAQFVSWLPRQTAPGQALPTAAAHALMAIVWLVWLRRPARSSR